MQPTAAKSDKADASRARILDAAARLFRERGYAAVSLREIADAAGMKAGSVYYHFDAKDSIVSEILDIGISAAHAEVSRAYDALPEDADAATVIRAAMKAHLQTLFNYSDYTSANVRIFAQVPEHVRKENLKARRAYEALWGSILASAAATGGIRDGIDLKQFKYLLIGSLNATLDWYAPHRGSLTKIVDNYADILLKGLLTPNTEAGTA